MVKRGQAVVPDAVDLRTVGALVLDDRPRRLRRPGLGLGRLRLVPERPDAGRGGDEPGAGGRVRRDQVVERVPVDAGLARDERGDVEVVAFEGRVLVAGEELDEGRRLDFGGDLARRCLELFFFLVAGKRLAQVGIELRFFCHILVPVLEERFG